MKRRSPDPSDAVPAELRSFVPAQWVGRAVEAPPGDAGTWPLAGAFRAWVAARSEWHEEHGWPTGGLARIREEMAARHLAAHGQDDNATPATRLWRGLQRGTHR